MRFCWGGGHLLANNFLVSQENNTPKAETTTTTFNRVSITYDNSYGAVTDASTEAESGGLRTRLRFTFELNSNYVWNSSSVSISTTYSVGSVNSGVFTYTRTGDEWSSLFSFPDLYFYSLTFPVASLVKANFVSQTYNINYNLNGGSYGSSHPSTYNSSTSSQRLTVSKPSRTGYTFSSWTVSGASASLSGTTLTIPAKATGNITLTANWTANTYYIKYNGNGATSGSMSNTTCRYGSSYTLRTNTFARTGYNFLGWATSSTGGVVYYDKQSVSNLTTSNGVTVNLYAVWQIQTFNISVIINDSSLGVISSNGGTYNYGASFSVTATANHNSTFVEWVNLDTGETYTENPLNITVTEDLHLQAKFAPNTITVLADIGGEVRMTGFDLADNNSIVHLSALAYKGYRFAGWTVNDGTDLSAYGDTADIPYILVKGKIVTANFEIINNLDVNGETDNNESGNLI